MNRSHLARTAASPSPLNGHFGSEWYDSRMGDAVALSEAKRQLGALVSQAHLSHEPVFLTKRGRRVAAIIDADTLDRMIERLEDLEDAEAADAARREMVETREAPIPWDEVKAELGLT